ncbi:MAG: hypothetical protein ACJ78Q_04595 [Chloroflexia bacterium]
MSSYPITSSRIRLHTARRVFSLLPIMVFLVAIMFLAGPVGHSYIEFSHVLLQAVAVSLATCFISMAAYGFYRYMLDRSVGL